MWVKSNLQTCHDGNCGGCTHIMGMAFAISFGKVEFDICCHKKDYKGTSDQVRCFYNVFKFTCNQVFFDLHTWCVKVFYLQTLPLALSLLKFKPTVQSLQSQSILSKIVVVVQ